MDKEYMNNCTSQWRRLDGNSVVELWEYFDSVHWDNRYAVKLNGEVRATFEAPLGVWYDVYEVLKQLF